MANYELSNFNYKYHHIYGSPIIDNKPCKIRNIIISDDKMKEIEEEMNSAFTPVSFNFTGAAFVNQHAAFSDLHVSGGNPAGNATFTNADFINKRYIWIGNRYML